MAVNEGEVILAICSRGDGKFSIREEENQELKVEAYRVLTSHLKQSGSKFLPQLSERFHEIVPLTLNDAGAAHEQLAVAALQFLGYTLCDPSLASISQAEVIVPVLCELALRQQASSEVVTSLLWCLANHKMNCSISLLTAHVKVQVLMISQLIMSHKHSTATVQVECLNLLHRMYRDHKDVFVTLDPNMWYPSLVTLLTASHQKNVTIAYQLAKKLEPLLVGNHDVACSLVDFLKEKLATVLYKQFANMKMEQTTLLIWQHFVSVLDRQLHNYGTWFNGFLKIVEQAFKHSDSEVQIAAYKAWRSLIDNYATSLRILTGSRRMKLIMTPLVGFPAHVRHEVVDIERFTVWQYLIERLGAKRAHSVKQVIAPLLLFSIGIDSRISNTILDEWALDGAYVCVTPIMPSPQENETKVSINIVHYGRDEATVISSPRIHPGIVYHSLLLSGCQLVMSLCDCPPNSQISGAVVPVMKCGDNSKSVFMKQPRSFLLFTEAILQLSQIVTSDVCRRVWQAVFQCATVTLSDPGILSVLPLVTPLMSMLRIAVKTEQLQQLAVHMVTKLCQLHQEIPFKLLSEEILVVSSLTDKKVFPWQFLLEIILHQPLILGKIEMVSVVTLFKFSITNGKHFINNLSLIVDMLKRSVPSDREHRWQLFDVWFNLMSTLFDKIMKVSKLCEDKSTNHVFSLLCDLLLYPVELLYADITIASSVPIEVRAKLVPSWTKLMDAVAMVTPSESCPAVNELVTMVVDKLVEFLQEQEAEVYMLCALTKMCVSLIEHTSFAKGDPSEAIIGELKLLKWILLKASQSQELLQGAMATSLFIGLTGVVMKMFTLLQGNELVATALDHMIPHLTGFFDGLYNQVDEDHSTLCTSLRKVWSSMATCLQARYTGSFSSELLALLSPLLVLMLSLRDRGRHNNSLCSQMLTFWCATFAKEATLVYPEKLRDAFKQFRHMGGRIDLPGWPDNDKAVTVIADSLNGHVEQENSLEGVEVKSSCSHKTTGSNPLESKGKKYLRARRKLPLDYYNSENVEVTVVTKKKRLLSRYHQKECSRERQRSCDAPQSFNHSRNSDYSTEELSTDEICQSDECSTMPVAMVIACEAGVNGVDDVSSPSLLFDSDTPVSIPHVTKLPSSNSQADSMATEQDSVNTIPDTVEDTGHVNCSDVSIGTTAECNGEDVTLSDTDNISVADSNNGTGETPVNSDFKSYSHLLDHSYIALHNGVGGADLSCEQLKCQEKMEKYSAMVTPLTGKVNVLLRDNGCHAARCSAIKRSNRRLARTRRQQVTSLLSNKQHKRGVKDKQIFSVERVSPQKISPLDLSGVEESCDQVQTALHVTPSPSSESDNTIATMVESIIAKSVDFVTKRTNSEQTVPQTMVTVTQLVDKVPQATVTMAQSINPVPQTMVTVTQSGDKVTQTTVAATQSADTQTTIVATQTAVAVMTQSATQSINKGIQTTKSSTSNRHLLETASRASTCTHSTITCSPPRVKAPCSVTNSNFRVNPMQLEQSMSHITKDTMTHQKDIVTQSTDTVTYLQRPPHTTPHHITSNSSSIVASTQTLVRYNQQQHHSVATTAPLQTTWQSDHYLQHYNNLLKQFALGTMSTAFSSTHGNQLPSVTNQLGKRPSALVGDDASSKMACLYGMLSSCLATSDYANPSLPVTVSTPAVPHVMSSGHRLPMIQNVFSDVNSHFAHSNRQLPGIIHQRQPIVFTGTDMPSYRNQLHPSTSVVPSNVATSASSACSRFRPIQAIKSPLITVLTSVNPSSVMSDKQVGTVAMATANSNHLQPVISSHVVSTNLPSCTSLAINSASVSSRSVSSSSATTLMSVNSPIVSLTSVSSPSVTTLMSVNSPTVSLTSVSSSSTNTSSVSLTSINCQTVTTATPINLLSVNSLSLVTSPSDFSVKSPSVTINSPSVSLTLVTSPTVTTLTSVNSPSVLTSGNSSSPTLTSVNSLSVTTSMSVNSPGVPVASVTSTSVTSLTSVNSLCVMTSPSLKLVSSPSDAAHVMSSSSNECPLNTLRQGKSPERDNVEVSASHSPVAIETVSQAMPEGSKSNNSVTIETVSQAMPEGNKSNNSVTIKTVSQAVPEGSKSSNSVTMETVSQAVPEGSKSSNSVAIETICQAVPEGSKSSNSVTIETICQAVPEGSKSSNSVTIETICQAVPEGDKSSTSGKQSTTESPPHTPTGGILKRVSQFDTPTISGKRRRVSFADTVENHENYCDVYSDRRYVTSPRSKLHSKASPRRLLAKPDKTSNTGKTKSSNGDHTSLPTYPALMSCDVPVDTILPDLISSPMARSLGALFHAREIRTVGDLASLPENQVRSMPIQQPKLQTLRNTLELFEKQLEQSTSKVANSDKSLSRESLVQSDHVPTPMDEQATVTNSDHVSSDAVTISDNQSLLVKIVNDQPATPPEVNDTIQSSCSADISPAATAYNKHSDMPTTNTGVIQDTPTSESATLEQPVSDRMQYLTESCSYDNSNDNLILATPESQSVVEDGQDGILATTNDNTTTCLNEDPLLVTKDDHQLHTNEGNSLQDDVITPINSIDIPNISNSRQELHDRLRAMGAEKFPEYLTKLDSFVNFIDDGHLDNENRKLLTTIIIDTLDYKLICNSKP